VPVYEYQCSNCGRHTDILQSVSDPVPSFCPECGAEGTLRKTFAPPAIVFKGSGWAKKDRRPASSGSKSGGSSASGSDGDAKGDTGSKGDAGSKGDSATSAGSGGSDKSTSGGTDAPAPSGSSASKSASTPPRPSTPAD
jgi:putative FmdB family regulatory protein